MSIKYTPDPSGLREAAVSPGMRAAVTRAAQDAKAVAEATAPRDSGHYAGSFSVRPTTDTVGRSRETRAAADLVNTAAYARYVKNNRRMHMLTVKSAMEGRR